MLYALDTKGKICEKLDYIEVCYDKRVVRFMKYTRFEKARIIGARALQITMGAPVLIKVKKDIIDPVKIAQMEFDKGVLPISVLRET